MRLEHQFTIPEPPDDVFALLLDVERIAPCLPGAQLTDRDGDSFSGSIRVKVGPLVAAYEGQATIKEIDKGDRTAVLVASGSEVGGQGGADARVRLHVDDTDGLSEVHIQTDLEIRGRAAQFGRGVLDDVGGRIVQQFARNLESTLVSPAEEEAVAAPSSAPATGRTERSVTSVADAEPLDLLGASWEPVLRRTLPYLLAGLAGLLLGRLLGRSRPDGSPGTVYVVPPSWSASEPPRRDRNG